MLDAVDAVDADPADNDAVAAAARLDAPRVLVVRTDPDALIHYASARPEDGHLDRSGDDH